MTRVLVKRDYRHRNIQRENHVRMQGKMAISKPRRVVLEGTNPDDTWSWTSSTWNCEKRNFCCLSHPVCGTLHGSPSRQMYTQFACSVCLTKANWFVVRKTEGMWELMSFTASPASWMGKGLSSLESRRLKKGTDTEWQPGLRISSSLS